MGIRREDKDVWERRTPLSPTHVKQLVTSGIDVFVQPSHIRCFPDEEYVKNGAKLSENLDEANVIFAMKEVPKNLLKPNKTYCFFSHTIKAQPKNMDLLQEILNRNITLIDYERFTDESGKRVVRSGPFAGIVGAIDSLHVLGERILAEYGLFNPFTFLSFSRNYSNLSIARNAVRNVGMYIEKYGLPKGISPLTFTVTGGDGAVASGVIRTLELLPHKYIKLEELPSFWENRKFASDRCIYIIKVSSSDYIVPLDKTATFNKKEYYKNPAAYESVFHLKVLPYTKVLFNAGYWDWKLPRLATTAQAKELLEQDKLPLMFLGDITADERGAIEFFTKQCEISDPFYLYDIRNGKISMNTLKGPGFPILGTSNLPAEFPVTSSEYFGDALYQFVKPMVECNYNVQFDDLKVIEPIKRAIIAHKGQLTPSHKYIFQLKEEYSQAGQYKILVLGSGSVCPPVIEYLMRVEQNRLTLATMDITRGNALVENYKGRANCTMLDVSNAEKLEQLIAAHHVVLSLVPPGLHVSVAKACLKAKRNLITASYISPEMRELDRQAREAGLLFLNEMGLDPGIDHMCVMRMLQEIESKSGKVISFKSYCGAIPDPKAAVNPLGYKFSWSPAGVISASQAPAKFLYKGELVDVPSEMLMCVEKYVNIYPGFNSVMIPNRDSMKYEKFYGLDKHPLQTMVRGTLRYPGFCNMFNTFSVLGLFKDESLNMTDKPIEISFAEFVTKVSDLKVYKDGQIQKNLLFRNLVERITQLVILKRNNAQVMSNYVFKVFGVSSDQEIRHNAMHAYLGMKKLDMLDFQKMITIKPGQTHKDIMCNHLIEKLAYAKNEVDFVFMHHKFTVQYPNDPIKKIHNSTLALYGDEKNSATALTVGFPMAIATSMFLAGKFQGLLGVIGPNDSSRIYLPVLDELHKEGIRFNEDTEELLEN